MRSMLAVAAMPLLLALAGLATGCQCDANGENCEVRELPEPREPRGSSIRIWGGDGQVAPAGAPLSEQIAGLRTYETATGGVMCMFAIESGGGSIRRPGTELGSNAGDSVLFSGRVEKGSTGRQLVKDGPIFFEVSEYCEATWVLGSAGVNTATVLFFNYEGPTSAKPLGCTNVTSRGKWLYCSREEYGSLRFSARAHGAASAIEIREGVGQSADVGQPLAIRPRIRVTDAGGIPVPGINVVFAADGGSGTPSDWVGAVTDRVGDARLPVDWVLGPAAGTHYLEAAAVESDAASPRLALTGNPVRFSATARPLVAARIDILDGDGQTTTAGQPVPQPVRVKVTDQTGGPVAGVVVDFIPDGLGTVAGASPTTDANGMAQPGSWTPGAGVAGTYGLWARAPVSQNIANNPVRFTATATAQAQPDQLRLGNGTDRSVNIVLSSETPSAANLLTPQSRFRWVTVPTAVGTVIDLRAYLDGALVATTSCTVTAAANFQSGILFPQVLLYFDTTFYWLCLDF